MGHVHPLKPLDAAFLAGMGRALAHPARVRILNHLLGEDQCTCGDLMDILPLAQSTVSQHLAVLRQAGVTESESRGRRVYYRVNRERLARFNGFLEAMLQCR